MCDTQHELTMFPLSHTHTNKNVRLESLNLEGNKLNGEVPEGVCNLGLKTIGIDCTVQCACCDGECSQ